MRRDCARRKDHHGTNPVPIAARLKFGSSQRLPLGKTKSMSQPYDRVYNFSAEPCTLPVPVLEQAKEDLINYKGTGMSVMEMSHRSKAYEGIIQAAEADLR